MTARFIVGDVRAALAAMPDQSVDLILTSPPFLALRSYLPADHPDKGKEIGSEATPGEFIDTLLDLTEEWARVLTEYGSLAVELGDTYSGSGGAGGDYNEGGLRETAPGFDGSARRQRDERFRRDDDHMRSYAARKRDGMYPHEGWAASKSLCLIPESYRWALVYGRNPFTGRETPRWRARNVVRWCRPNPPVGALGDKFRPATSEMVIACKSARRWFDLDAVREPLKDSPGNRYVRKISDGDRDGRLNATDGIDRETNKITADYDPSASAGAPPLDWWEIPTQPFKGAHYATFPEKLVTRPIDAMCPRQVCTVCGEPRRRITEDNPELAEAKRRVGDKWKSGGLDKGLKRPSGDDRIDVPGYQVTLGWSDCGHDSYRRGVVLDPFVGSGTTLAVAEGLGRDSIGIDLDSRNAELAYQRVGMFLTVDTPQRPVVVVELPT